MEATAHGTDPAIDRHGQVAHRARGAARKPPLDPRRHELFREIDLLEERRVRHMPADGARPCHGPRVNRRTDQLGMRADPVGGRPGVAEEQVALGAGAELARPPQAQGMPPALELRLKLITRQKSRRGIDTSSRAFEAREKTE